MRCNNCQREIDNAIAFCPFCGAALDVPRDFEAFSQELGSRVDEIKSSGGDIYNINDGVQVNSGRMDIGDTKNLSPAANDSVFTREEKERLLASREKPRKKVVVREYRLSEEDLINDFSDQEEQKEQYEEEAPEEYYGEETFEEPEEAYEEEEKPRKSKFWVVLIVTFVILLLLIGGFWFFFIRNPGGGSQSSESQTTQTETTQEIVADTINCSVEDGEELEAPAVITMSSALGNRLYYTINGSAPNIESTRYVGPITIRSSDISGESSRFTLKIVSYSSTSMKSGEYEVSFTVKLPAVAAPVITPESGDYGEEQKIFISAETGATIYYTYDGTTPTTASIRYTGGIDMLKGNNVLSAIAVKDGRISPVASAVFNLELKPKYTYEQAEEEIKSFLKAQGIIDDELNTPKEGYVTFSSLGSEEINEVTHYIIKVTEYDKDKKEVSSDTYAVNDQTLEISLIN